MLLPTNMAPDSRPLSWRYSSNAGVETSTQPQREILGSPFLPHAFGDEDRLYLWVWFENKNSRGHDIWNPVVQKILEGLINVT